MKLFAKNKIKPYKDNSVYADNEIAQRFRELMETSKVIRYAGRRIFRIINRSMIRTIMSNAKFHNR